MKKLILLFLLISAPIFSQEIALLKYNGGGDWYANPTSLPNLIKYCNQTIGTKISEWAMERSLARDANKVAEMITSPDGIKKLRELRQMSPTSAKRWAGTAQLLGNYGIIELKD